MKPFFFFFSMTAIAATIPQPSHVINTTSDALFEFHSRQQTNPTCKQGLPSSASAYEISQRIEDLKGRTDDCGLNPGQCMVLECAYNACIQWCNNNNHYASWKCRDFWPHAQGILNECSYSSWLDGSTAVWGVENDVQGFQVQVGYRDC